MSCAVFTKLLTISFIGSVGYCSAQSLESHLVARLRFDGNTAAEPHSFFTSETGAESIAYSDDAIDGQ